MERAAISSPATTPGTRRLDPVLVAVCLAVLTLPVEISGLLFPTTLVNLSRLAVVAALGLIALGWARGRRPVLPPRGITLATAAVIGLDLLSFGLTRWPDGLREVVAVAFYAAFAFALLQVLTDRDRLRIVGACFLVAGLLEAGLIVAEGAVGFYLTEIRDMAGRRNGTFIDPNIAARFLVLGVAAAIGAARISTRAWPLLPILVAGLAPVALVLTFSRSGWVLFGLAALLLVVALRERRALIVGAVAAVAFAVAVLAIPNALHRATDVPVPAATTGARNVVALVLPAPQPVDSSAPAPATPLDGVLERLPIDKVRRYLARAAVAMFVDHPLTGVGVGGYRPMIEGPYNAYIDDDYRGAAVTVAHTDVLRIAAEEGILGIGVLALFLAAVLRTAARAAARMDPAARAAAVVAAVGVLVVFLAAQTEGRFYADPYLWLGIGVLVALARPPGDGLPSASLGNGPGSSPDA